MTVAELIEWLQKQPQQATVLVETVYDSWSGAEWSEVDPSMLHTYIPWNKPESEARVSIGNK